MRSYVQSEVGPQEALRRPCGLSGEDAALQENRPPSITPAGSFSRTRDNLGLISQSSLTSTFPSPHGAGQSDQSGTEQ